MRSYEPVWTFKRNNVNLVKPISVLEIIDFPSSLTLLKPPKQIKKMYYLKKCHYLEFLDYHDKCISKGQAVPSLPNFLESMGGSTKYTVLDLMPPKNSSASYTIGKGFNYDG